MNTSSPSDSESERPEATPERPSAHLALQQLIAEQQIEPRSAMLWMIHAYRYSQLAHAMAELGIADALAAGPVDTEQLGRRVQVPAQRLVRLLRGLAWCGAVTLESRDGDQQWALTALGRTLVSNPDSPANDGSLADDAIQAGGLLYPAWGELTEGLRTGRVPFELAQGKRFFEQVGSDPVTSERFDRVMNRIIEQNVRAVVAVFDFSDARCIVDIGGGNGETLARLLAHAPKARGIVFDLARSKAAARSNLLRHGCAERCELIAGDFFESVAPGGDLYVLQRILHDWPDADCVRILGNVAQVLSPGARVLILEEVLALGKPGPDDHAIAIDLAMMAVTGGQERTTEEYEKLAVQAGLRLIASHPTSSGVWVLELSI